MELKTGFSIIFLSLFVYHIIEASFIDSGELRSDGSNHEGAEVKYDYQIKTLQVPVDHFSFALNGTYDMRYLVNNTWQRGNNPPIFFYTGNEGDIELFAQNTGFMWEIAPNFGALLVFAEHRYYGQSLPFGNLSYSEPSHLGYLTSQQALADFADLIDYLKTDSRLKNSPVILFGGSYGGMLSAWMRMKYPHLVAGAIAASAPILQFTDITPCEVFSRVVTSDFKAANSECSKSIRNSWTAIDNVASTDDGKKWLKETWKFCKPFTNSSDIKLLKDFLTEIYGNLAMVNYPYASNFLAPLPANPIFEFCKFLTNSTLEDKQLLIALNRALNLYTNGTGNTNCIDITGDASPNLDAKGWGYQSCTEMVMPMCSDGIADMFEPVPWDFQKFSDDCYATYKVRPQPYLACEEYGCKDLSAASNIVFSNGLLDPWASGGVLTNVSSTTLSVLIPEAAHHLDLRASNSRDPFSIIQVRELHRHYIDKWINEHLANVYNTNTTYYEVVNL